MNVIKPSLLAAAFACSLATLPAQAFDATVDVSASGLTRTVLSIDSELTVSPQAGTARFVSEHDAVSLMLLIDGMPVSAVSAGEDFALNPSLLGGLRDVELTGVGSVQMSDGSIGTQAISFVISRRGCAELLPGIDCGDSSDPTPHAGTTNCCVDCADAQPDACVDCQGEEATCKVVNGKSAECTSMVTIKTEIPGGGTRTVKTVITITETCAGEGGDPGDDDVPNPLPDDETGGGVDTPPAP